MFDQPAERIWAFACALTCAWAFWRGGRWERIGALIFICGTLGSQLAQQTADLLRPQFGVLIVDAFMFAAFLALLLRTNRWWPLGCCAFILLEVCSHLSYWFFQSVGAWAYLASMTVWSYMLLICLFLGTFEARRRDRAPPPRRLAPGD